METAKVTATKLDIANKTSFYNCALNNYSSPDSEKFDLILCSHVIQHIHTDGLPMFLCKFNELLKPNGLLIITTYHSTKGYNYFTKAYMHKEDSTEEAVPKKEFNPLIKNNQNITPVHFFTVDSPTAFIPSNFKIIDIKVFHCVEKNLNILNIFKAKDKFINSLSFLLNRFG